MSLNLKLIDELIQRFNQSLPPGSNVLKDDIEKNLRAVLHSAFTKMDLVTREEFEVQAKVLARSRTKLESLEKRVSELEQERKGN